METDVMTVWSGKAVLTFAGIIYMVILFSWWLRRGIVAWGCMWLLAVLGAFYVGIQTDDVFDGRPAKSGYNHMYRYEGGWKSEWELLFEEEYLHPKDEKPVYRMTVEGMGKWYHPAMWVWCPFFLSLALVPLWLILRVPFFGFAGPWVD